MTTINFYEKPGCANNTRQKKLLTAAGHHVIAKNLLTEPWTAARLLQFFAGKPVDTWFNRAAPKVKSGEVIPEQIAENKALQMMLSDPLLIRRPLIEAAGHYEIGFDAAKIDAWLGLTQLPQGDIESCKKIHDEKACKTPT
jgi:nitrogenase-associated protein